MTTEMSPGFEMEGTTLTQPIDVDQLIDGLTDEQIDKLTLMIRRRTNAKLRQAATLAAMKAERERAVMPAEQVRNFVRQYDSIAHVFDPRATVTIYANGASLVPINLAIAMPGAVELIEHPSNDWLRRCQVIYHFHETQVYIAKLRKQEVLTDNSLCSQGHSVSRIGPENAREMERVNAIVNESGPAVERLASLCTLIHQIQIQHTGEERDKLILEAVSAEPTVARWMTKKED